LAVCLRGQEQGALGNLPHDQRQDFGKLVRSLEERFSPSNQTELYSTQLRERRQRAAESLPELGQEVRRLANLAYPTGPNDVKETLAKEQFIDALVSSDMRLRIKQARPTNLDDAVRHAVELEAFNKAEEKRGDCHGYIRTTVPTQGNSNMDNAITELIKKMQSALTNLQKEVKSLNYAQNSNSK
jgi:oligoendopeptidase F